MAKRYTDTEKFNDQWYRELSPVFKCIWEYMLSQCDHAGLLKLDLGLMSFQIGSTITLEDLKSFGERLHFVKDDLIFIPKFITFQYGELNPENKVHRSVLKLLDKYNIKTLDSPLLGSKDKDKDKDKYKDKEKIINKDPYINDDKKFFENEYEKIFGQKPMLMQNHCTKLFEICSLVDLKEVLPEILLKLKGLNFEEIDFKPTASWLLSDDNFSKMLEGQFDKKTKYKKPIPIIEKPLENETEERLTPEQLKEIREKAMKGHNND